MALKLFEFTEQFMIDTFFDKKTGSIGKLLILLENLKNNTDFRYKKLITFSVTLYFCCSIVEFASFQ